jgi:MFS transporter, ACS family, hexuronate transporter
MASRPSAGPLETEFVSRDPDTTASLGPIGKYRWTICALLFLTTTINYLDRQVTGVLGPTLQKEFGWSEIQYANITPWWTAAYAIGFLFVGRFIDKVGVRIRFAAA